MYKPIPIEKQRKMSVRKFDLRETKNILRDFKINISVSEIPDFSTRGELWDWRTRCIVQNI